MEGIYEEENSVNTAMSMIATNSIPVVNVFANEVVKDKAVAIEKSVSKNMTVTDFKIKITLTLTSITSYIK
ncbi:hypothetical protein H477_2380 [[Clostridium] sordellii ATCC 9714]|nr:hypothetical protein H477_2380 [[Clostridium] sordellii ATCC 9714] [Paeniclostridium sordellii ATCC 9714]